MFSMETPYLDSAAMASCSCLGRSLYYGIAKRGCQKTSVLPPRFPRYWRKRMTSADIRAGLRRGAPTVGAWLQLPSSDVAEIIGRMGYEWAAVDMEHGAFSRSGLPDIFRALERRGTLPFVRLLEATKAEIKAALDSGAQGLIFPMIESRAQLDDAISHSLYPGGKEFAHGKRGVGFSRANMYGLDFDSRQDGGFGQEIVLVAQIEHVNALRELDAIFSHPRLDAYMVGPYDLSASMGLTGNFAHPDFTAALKDIENAAKKHGMARGIHVVTPNPAELQAKIAEGYSFLAYGTDALFLSGGATRPAMSRS